MRMMQIHVPNCILSFQETYGMQPESVDISGCADDVRRDVETKVTSPYL